MQGQVLSTTITVLTCKSSPATTKQATLTIDYTYRTGTDSLLDSQGATWHRS